MVLSYRDSCVRETVTGGMVTVGTEQSEVRSGQVNSIRGYCATGKTVELSDGEMNAEEQRALVIEVEESLNDEHLTGQTLQYLRSCSRLRVDRNCTNTINEFKTYTYPKRRRLNTNYKEVPRDWMNHSMDAWGYYVWVKKRFEGEPEALSYSYLETHIEPLEEDNPEQDVLRPRHPPEEIARMPQSRARMFAEHVRSFHSRGVYEPQSYLEVAGR